MLTTARLHNQLILQRWSVTTSAPCYWRMLINRETFSMINLFFPINSCYFTDANSVPIKKSSPPRSQPSSGEMRQVWVPVPRCTGWLGPCGSCQCWTVQRTPVEQTEIEHWLCTLHTPIPNRENQTWAVWWRSIVICTWTRVQATRLWSSTPASRWPPGARWSKEPMWMIEHSTGESLHWTGYSSKWILQWIHTILMM